jgi:hypothetical protein
VNAQDVTIGKKARRLEALIVRKLNRVFRTDIKPQLGNTSIGTLRNSEVGAKIERIIRSMVDIGYFTGAQAVSGFLRDPEPITTQEDIVNIELFAREMENEFWGMIEKQERRAEEVEIVDNQLQALLPYDERAAVLGIGSFIAFYAVNHGMLSKTNELAPKIAALPDVDVLERFGRKALITIQDRVRSQGESPVILVYLTASDSRVDPQFCAPLHRQEFELDDPLPPLPQHRHCRCVIIPKNTLTNEFMI